MPHFRVDDALHSHPKARQAGLEAMGLWNLCGSYCMGYLTDGFVPEWYVKTWPKGMALAKRLVTARMWYPAEKDGETGWQFHEFTGPGRNDSREQVEESRKKWRDKKAGQRADSPPYSPRDSRRESPGDTLRESTRDSLRATRDPTQPNPTEKNSGCETLESPVSSQTNAARGSRLPDGWEPSADVIAQMRSDHPGVDLRSEHLKFVDYWHGKAGRDARKADWTATWRNWIRRAAEQQHPRAASNGVPKVPVVDRKNAGLDAIAAKYTNGNQQQEITQ